MWVTNDLLLLVPRMLPPARPARRGARASSAAPPAPRDVPSWSPACLRSLGSRVCGFGGLRLSGL